MPDAPGTHSQVSPYVIDVPVIQVRECHPPEGFYDIAGHADSLRDVFPHSVPGVSEPDPPHADNSPDEGTIPSRGFRNHVIPEGREIRVILVPQSRDLIRPCGQSHSLTHIEEIPVASRFAHDELVALKLRIVIVHAYMEMSFHFRGIMHRVKQSRDILRTITGRDYYEQVTHRVTHLRGLPLLLSGL